MLVVAHKRLFDFQIVQELQRYPRILGGDKVRLLERFAAAHGDIGQVSDGCRDKIEHSGHGQVSS